MGGAATLAVAAEEAHLERSTGTFDLHVHSAPDVAPRKIDDVELALFAEAWGMAGLLLKSHHFSTVERAFVMRKLASGLRAYGGLVLNSTVGGLNPEAVEIALQLGARCIWMPTLSARHHIEVLGGSSDGLTVLADDGVSLLPAVLEILDLVAAADVLLCTGHLSPPEVSRLAEVARARGVQRILVQHVESVLGSFPIETQRALAAQGCVLEHCYVATMPIGGDFPLEAIARAIADVGAASCVVSTDLGQPENPHPVPGMGAFIGRLADLGVEEADLQRMSVANPIGLCSP
jgi:hypothetical protein